MFFAINAVTRHAVTPGARFTLAGDLAADLFTVPGKVRLYLEGDDRATDNESAANVGIEFRRPARGSSSCPAPPR